MVLLLMGVSSLSISAQLSRGGKPSELVSKHSPWIQLDDIHSDQLLLEDEWAAMTGKKSQRIAGETPCALNPDNSGQWLTLPDGSRIWQLGLEGKGVLALGLVFNRFYLEPGIKLFVFDPQRQNILGAYTNLNNKSSYMLALSYLSGDKLIVQLEVPSGQTEYGELMIGAVRQAYRPVFTDKSARGFGSSGSCNVDINCTLGNNWQLAKRSVVRLVNKENCTGVLINNTKQDSTAYVLTAAHCLFTNNVDYSSTTIFYFNYESPTCDGPDGITYHSISGATLISTGDTLETTVDTDSLDFALLELSFAPPDSFVPYFAGWNRSSTPPLNTATIHHPSSDVMKISVDNDPSGSGVPEPQLSYASYLVRGCFWRVLKWEAGTTEGGSSGGPLFDQNQRIVGTLTGGQASCDNSVNDDFTRFDYAWDYYPDSLRQLKHWLDPGNTGVMSLNGFDPLPGTEVDLIESPVMKLYPNPAQNVLNIEVRDRIPRNVEISLYNTAGVMVSRFTEPGQQRISIPVGNLPAGIYFLQLRSDDLFSSERFIIYR